MAVFRQLGLGSASRRRVRMVGCFLAQISVLYRRTAPNLNEDTVDLDAR
jgi:hypothetical protein